MFFGDMKLLKNSHVTKRKQMIKKIKNFNQNVYIWVNFIAFISLSLRAYLFLALFCKCKQFYNI